MAVLSFFGFKGMRNAMSPKLIPEQFAQVAIEADVRKGTLQPFDGLKKIANLTKSGTLHTLFQLIPDLWLHWNETVNIARMPIANNEYHRIAFTGTDQPRYTDEDLAIAGGGTNYPEVSYALGLPVPAYPLNAISAQKPYTGMLQLLWDISGTTDVQGGGKTARVYTYTYVAQNGDEGPPADPSDVVYANDDDQVTLDNFAPPPSGNFLIDKIRIYRSVAGSSGFTYLLVDEVAGTTTTYTDTKLDSALGASMTTTLYTPPPEDLAGITAMANGMLAGFKGNAVYFSEPYQGHAWPEDYVRYVDDDVIGLSSSGNMLFIMTTGNPYVAVGNYPTVISLNKLDRVQACVSAPSIADMGGGVIYAAEEGLVAIVGSKATVITDGIVDRKFWKSLNPSSILGTYHNDRYYGFYSAAAAPDPLLPASGGFIYDPNRQELMMLNFHTTAVFGDPISGRLYVVQKNGAANEVHAWDYDTAAKRTFTWRSKINESNLRNLEAARVSARAWPVDFKLIAEGTTVFSKSVTSPEPFRLPTGYQARNVEVEVSGAVEVDMVMLADYVGELQ